MARGQFRTYRTYSKAAMLPKAKMELTPLERKEVHYRRQKPASNDPSLTAQTYLLG